MNAGTAPGTVAPKKKLGWNDVIFTVIAHGVRGDNIIELTPKRLAKLGIVLLLFTVVPDQLIEHAKRADVDARRPQMEALADAGKDEAAVWLVKHYFWDERHRLPALVAKGNAQALYMQGALRVHDGDQKGGMAQVEQAAAQGWLPAIEYVEQHKAD